MSSGMRVIAVAPQAVLAFVEMLQRGVVGGRASVYCISDLRQYFQGRASGVASRDGNESLLHMSSGPGVSSVRDEFWAVAQACLVCVLSQNTTSPSTGLFSNGLRSLTGAASSGDSATGDQVMCAITLDLLPYRVWWSCV